MTRNFFPHNRRIPHKGPCWLLVLDLTSCGINSRVVGDSRPHYAYVTSQYSFDRSNHTGSNNTLLLLSHMSQIFLDRRPSNPRIPTSSNGNIFRVTGPLWGKPPVTGGFPSRRPVTRSFDVFFDLPEETDAGDLRRTSSRSLWRHCNVDRTICWKQPKHVYLVGMFVLKVTRFGHPIHWKWKVVMMSTLSSPFAAF